MIDEEMLNDLLEIVGSQYKPRLKAGRCLQAMLSAIRDKNDLIDFRNVVDQYINLQQ
jgi:hypothetical protein